MLSRRTRSEVRAPFAIQRVIDKVEKAKSEYQKLLESAKDKLTKAIGKYVVELNAARTLSEQQQVLYKYQELSNLKLVDDLFSYAETLRFLDATVADKTTHINLSQSEFLALDRDDSALSDLNYKVSILDRILKCDY
jgi:hypothetical protein